MDIYQHFRKDERPFIDQVLSWKEQVESSFINKQTDFLDPREQQIVSMIIGNNDADVKLDIFGGFQNAERRRAIISPYYEEVTENDFQITMLEANYPEKFLTLTHRDILGACLSLGIKRNVIGDIIVEDGKIQIITAAEIAAYVIANLTSINKATITLKEKPLSSIMEKQLDWTEREFTAASLRLDVVLKETYHLSRKSSLELIKRQFVKVNYKVVEDAKFLLRDGDMLSVRGKGRSKLVSINGRTKKDKLKITMAVLK
ncbi:RNA-binding protein [Virgibacillus sp. YIM 98842]|uniref:YlmH family RNA-binding protein n=1 Tax=Virgibacillus sp. YIM 98842 TaxID=2663533 RepID=UPI0013DAC0FB|nr:RNA-binding protein [Virgibacillus sp. YIM 98842]